MNRTSKEVERGLGGTALQSEPNLTGEYRSHHILQASCAIRTNRTCSIGELMPRVYSVTLAQGLTRVAVGERESEYERHCSSCGEPVTNDKLGGNDGRGALSGRLWCSACADQAVPSGGCR